MTPLVKADSGLGSPALQYAPANQPAANTIAANMNNTSMRSPFVPSVYLPRYHVVRAVGTVYLV